MFESTCSKKYIEQINRRDVLDYPPPNSASVSILSTRLGPLPRSPFGSPPADFNGYSVFLSKQRQSIRMDWEDPRLFFVAREPFISRHSSAELVTGWIGNGEELLLE